MKRRLLAVALVMSMLMGCFVITSAATGSYFYKNQTVFEQSGNSYYRIPMLVVGQNGVVFAFCNDRQGSNSDYADIQWISYSKAEDGVNFSTNEYLLQKDGWSYIIGSAVYDAVNNNLMLVYYSYIKTDAAQAEYDAMSESEKAANPLGTAIIETKDGGATWTKRAVKMPVANGGLGTTVSIHGAGTGIQLKHGEKAGRLVFAAKAGNSSLASVKVMAGRMVSTLVYSDDYGKTWTACDDCMPYGTDETSLCELPDGSLYVTSRMISNINGRYVAYSYDSGKTLSDMRIDKSLEVQCQYGIRGGVTNIPDYDGKGNSLTLFCSLNSPVAYRRNLAIWLSYDNGQTWVDKVIMNSGFCSYSEIVYNTKTGYISLIQEDQQSAYISTFDVNYLLINKQANTSLRGTSVIDKNIEVELVTDSMYINLLESSNATGSAILTDNAVNGEKAYKFSGSDTLTMSHSQIKGDMSYFIVFKADSEEPDNSVLLQSTHAQGIKTYLSTTSSAPTTQVGTGVYNAAEAQKFQDIDWHVLAVSWSGDGNNALMTQFLDGNTGLKYELGSPVAITAQSSGAITLGESFKGLIADVLVYNRALSDEEIAKTGLYLADKYGLEWQLTDTSTVVLKFDDISEYRQNTYTAPSVDDMVFAGWYEDFKCTVPLGTQITGGVAYAKFVDEDVLSVLYQTTGGTMSSSAYTNLRLITGVESEMLSSVGFKITFGDVTVEKSSKYVYSSIAGGDVTYGPQELSGVCKYFATYSVTNVPNSAFYSYFDVVPTWKTLDGTVVEGISAKINVASAVLAGGLNAEAQGSGSSNSFDNLFPNA
ncbi:MAG: exo-alpha-sialidase [Clostridia bacterium]|nr:exo-alpha-sialidase [Clostridia bacterium]